MKATLVKLFFVIFIACGVPQADYDQVVQRADSLQAELDEANIELAEIKSGPEMQLNEAKKYLAADNFEAAKLILEALMVQYPNSSEAAEANQIFADLNARENPGQAIDTSGGK